MNPTPEHTENSTLPTDPTSHDHFAIVVGLDFESAGGFAFEEAARIARRIPGSHIHLVHAFEKELDEQAATALTGRLKNYADDKAAFVGGLAGSTVGVHLRTGHAADVLRSFALEVAADLIILGSKKHGLKGLLTGSTAEKLTGLARCPVLITGPKPAEEGRPLTMEAPCPACVGERTRTQGASWWCDLHHGHARQTHCYSYSRKFPLTSPDNAVRPTGV